MSRSANRQTGGRGVDAAPETAVGRGDEGPFRVNPAEDGPDMLIAGTTGSENSDHWLVRVAERRVIVGGSADR
jgi:hypothetical protein